MLSKNWLAELPVAPILLIKPVFGGDINDAYALKTKTGTYFLKVQRQKKVHFFSKEVNGLRLLGKTVRTPEVIDAGEIDEDAFLLLEWIESGSRDDKKLAVALASLHKQTNELFGFSEDNYLGKLPQYNHPEKDWASFYIHCRLLPQVKMAKEKGLWTLNREKRLTHLVDKIRSTYQTLSATPSLLHGDLWGGNVMFAANGEPVFIDPAVFYGNREMDITMTQLFGGFGPSFYQVYNERYPLDNGWQERVPWYQLYYLLAHLNLFGEGYGAAVDRALNS
ncbi:fructosamine kinase family protein [Bacillus sp. 03113]|uniref:fructosamine kinase family protein n=1 Tax=Bacillus sp. 03113 TaxID=2578211 RepID=UPI001143DA67|nr:fructosamine kinase family protein [Bacillus sp. 03113]